jgi:hypothetical protein
VRQGIGPQLRPKSGEGRGLSTLGHCTIPVDMEEPQPISDEAPGRPPALTPNSIHLVRPLQQMMLGYSQMADQKAAMLMAATFVVFTIAVGQARGGAVPIALSVLALFAFTSALCAILAVLPSFAKASAAAPNRIFFGVFAHLPEDEWIDGAMAGLTDDATFYRTILRDIHQNGVLLERKKYRWLVRGYRTFLVGLCATAVVFMAEFSGVFAPLG